MSDKCVNEVIKYSFWQFRAKISFLLSIFSRATNIVNAIYYENSLRRDKQMLGFKRNLEINLNSKLVNRRRNSKKCLFGFIKIPFFKDENLCFFE